MCKLGRYILFSIFVISFFNLNAQPELKFEHYTTDQGLIHNYVRCIFQDNYGFIWFGTHGGISRFDGLTFKNYLYDDSDSCSVPSGWIYSIEAGKRDQLLVVSSNRLASYDYNKDCFKQQILYLKDHNENQAGSSSAILYNNKELIWTVYSEQFVTYNLNTKKTIPVTTHEGTTIPIAYATFFYEDKNGFIWIGTSGEGLFRYNRNDSSYIYYQHDPEDPNSISSDFIYYISEDSRGNMWLGTDKGGLNRYIPPSSLSEKKEQEHGRFERYLHNPNDPNSLSHNTVYSICEDTENNLWIGTKNGLCLFNRDSKKFYTYYYDDRDPESLNDNIIRSLYCDKFGNLWIGTRLGIAKLKKNRFKTYKYSSYKNSLSHNKVDYLMIDAAQNIFVCTPVGIDYFDLKSNTFQIFKRVEKGGACFFASPIYMTSDPDNDSYWIGTYNGGLYHYNINTQKCTAYTHINNDTATLSNNTVFSVCFDSEDTVLVGTWGSGLNIFNKKTGEFKQVPYDFEINRKISCIYKDRDNNIWIGTSTGLCLFDKNAGYLKQYVLNKQKEYIYISCILQSKDGNLWMGTYDGLYRVNTKTGEKRNYSIENGLPIAQICSVLEDDSQNIWVSTMNGIARFLPNPKQKDSIFFKTYKKGDGLQSNFLGRSCCKLNDGRLAFGGSEGLSIFHPDSIKEDTVVSNIALTGFKIFNKPVNIGEELNGRIILNQSLLTTDTIYINYQNNNFTIEFAALHYRAPELNQYAYKLEGYDKEWNYTHAQNRYATYTDLPYNTYNFFVKASNSDGIWSKEIKKLTIRVLPPWWLTIWFKILGILVIISLIIFWFKLKTYNLRQQKKTLEEQVEHRTKQLTKANQILEESREELQQQAEILADVNKKMLDANTNLEIKTIEVEKMARTVHEADQSKLRFFANISHEFRTPLSLIIGPLEKYLNTAKYTNVIKVESSYIKLMYQNAKRLLKLINEVIDFRKMDQAEKKLQVSNNNINEFISEIVNVFSIQAEQKDISLHIEDMNDEHIQYVTDFWFDPNIMEKILYNIISNAIKYTPEGGNVSIQLSVNKKQSTVNSEQSTVNSNQLSDGEKLLTIHYSLLIKVIDSGIGIEKENLDKVFDRFYRVESKESLSQEGTGIGLAYTKELVTLHKGIILIESEFGKGSTFTLQFPIGKEHFMQETISNKSTDIKLDYINSMIETFEKNIDGSKNAKTKGKSLNDSENSKKPTILLVEDNNDLRKFIKEELETHYNVLEAENGEIGWKIASESDPGLIISDIMMPVMNGIELCRKIKADENTSHIPIILLTAKTNDESALEGLETGANDYITKPFVINILKIKINNLFLLQKKLQEKFSQSVDIVPSEVTQSLVDEQFIQKAIKVINENMQDFEFENSTFVELMNYDKNIVYKKIRNLTGQSANDFIDSIRLKAAAKLFLEGNLSVAEVCYRVGFKHHSIFTRKFEKMFGTSPAQFLEERLKKT